MVPTREESIEFLKKAKEELEELQTLKETEAGLSEKEDRLENLLNTEKRRMNDTIQTTIRNRREELRATYDKELTKLHEQLKKVRSRREKAKNQGMKERIDEETAVYIEENKSLTKQMSNLAKQKRLPFICRTKLYYSLYFPRHLKEFMVLLFYAAVFFGALPGGIYLMLPQRRAAYLIGIYAVLLLVVGGLYLFIGNRTKLLYMETLRECRAILDSKVENNRKIRRVTKEIKRDRNESHYDLGKFDDEISRLQQEQQEVSAKEKDALETYENVTKTILTDEIENSFQEKLEQLERDHNQAEEELKAARMELKEKNLLISDRYGAHLGRDFMDPAKVARLCLLIQDGYASTVNEAKERYKERENN